ncbi:MAG: lysozyme inhibitor LprI family protein [Candidatus Acidiferrum sp.]
MLDCGANNVTECLQSPGNADDQTAAATSAPNRRASFDCEAPSSALEIVICADAELGKTDIEMTQAYHDADKAMTASQHKGLIDSERQWLRFVSKACPLGTVGGIPSVLARSCVRAAFLTRILQLQACPQKNLQERMPCLNDFYVIEKSTMQ